jgi:predicted nucleic acid-binding protein
MMREVLLDTNMLIATFDGKAGDVEEQRRALVEALVLDPEVRLWITPLVYYEVLRGTQSMSLVEMEAVLKDFEQIEISKEHGHRAAELYRRAKEKGKSEWLDKRRFDVFHCVCAELYDLEFVHSDEGDIPKIQQLINESRQQ